MNLGELFIELGVVGDVKPLKNALKTMQQAQAVANRDITLNKLKLKLINDVGNATTKQQKKLLADTYVQERRNVLQADDIKKTQEVISGKKELANSIAVVITKTTAFVGSVVATVAVVDRMVNSLLRANQAFINFNRQTGLSIDKLNQYAAAGAAVDYNLSLESVANSIQSLQSNLAQIRLGQGNIAPFQLLGVNPVGQDAFGVIEQLREAIKGVSDIDATNIIQQMGLSPEFISILRLSREEFEQLQDEVFLNSANRQAMTEYATKLRKVHLQFQLLKDKALLKILPLFVKLMQHLQQMIQMWAQVAQNIINFVKASENATWAIKKIGQALLLAMIILHPVIAAFTALYLILEDIAVYFMGGDSIIGIAMAGLQDLADTITETINKFTRPKDNGFLDYLKEVADVVAKITPLGWVLDKLNQAPINANAPALEPPPLNYLSSNGGNRTFNQNNNINIHSQQPVAPTVANEIIAYTNAIDQIPVFS